MGGCSAINCSNHSRNKFRMFRFPTDPERRRKWTLNCRRDAWVPGPSAELCSVHFEESQFEQHRADGWKKLKPNAVPTLFDVPNPPAVFANKRIKGKGLPVTEVHFEQSQFEAHRDDNCRKLKQTAVPTLFDVPNPPPIIAGRKGVRLQKSGSALENIHVSENIPDVDVDPIIKENVALRKREKELEAQLEDMKTRYLTLCNKMCSFLTEEQMKFLGEDLFLSLK